MTILKNSAICKKCKEQITSRSSHDFVKCKCGALAIDGGIDYIKICGDLENYIDASTYSTDSHDKIRNEFEWGTYGKVENKKLKNINQKVEKIIQVMCYHENPASYEIDERLKYIKLCDMEKDHIIAVLETQRLNGEIKKVFEDELEFRNINYQPKE